MSLLLLLVMLAIIIITIFITMCCDKRSALLCAIGLNAEGTLITFASLVP